MIKTGQTVNIQLGHGDSGKFDLLGGSFGEAGDILFNLRGLRAAALVRRKGNPLARTDQSGLRISGRPVGWRGRYRERE